MSRNDYNGFHPQKLLLKGNDFESMPEDAVHNFNTLQDHLFNSVVSLLNYYINQFSSQ